MEIVKPESTDFTVPEDTYHFAITDAALVKGNNGIYAQLAFTVQEGDQTGKTLNFQNYFFTEKAVWRFINLLEAVSDTTFTPGQKVDFDPETQIDELLNEEFWGKVTRKPDTYKEEQTGEKAWRNEVQRCFSLSRYAQMRKDTDAYVASAPEREKMPF